MEYTECAQIVYVTTAQLWSHIEILTQVLYGAMYMPALRQADPAGGVLCRCGCVVYPRPASLGAGTVGDTPTRQNMDCKARSAGFMVPPSTMAQRDAPAPLAEQEEEEEAATDRAWEMPKRRRTFRAARVLQRQSSRLQPRAGFENLSDNSKESEEDMGRPIVEEEVLEIQQTKSTPRRRKTRHPSFTAVEDDLLDHAMHETRLDMDAGGATATEVHQLVVRPGTASDRTALERHGKTCTARPASTGIGSLVDSDGDEQRQQQLQRFAPSLGPDSVPRFGSTWSASDGTAVLADDRNHGRAIEDATASKGVDASTGSDHCSGEGPALASDLELKRQARAKQLAEEFDRLVGRNSAGQR